ncbi:MAG: hypothetical protein ABI205_10570 [Gemmatimonadaceae bacterium]
MFDAPVERGIDRHTGGAAEHELYFAARDFEQGVSGAAGDDGEEATGSAT